MHRGSCLVIVCAATALACSTQQVRFTGDGHSTEDCAAPGDEDGNGLADCSDPACAAAAACQPVCGAGHTDCSDPACAAAAACQPVCGDGKIDPGEDCDDGNTAGADGCSNRCTVSAFTYVKAINTGTDDEFGTSVALSADGSTLAVGAIGEASAATGVGGDPSDDSLAQAGAVYVYTRSGATWRFQAYVKASNTDAHDSFGTSVALSADGSTLAVGSIGEASAATGVDGRQTDNSALNAGAVYVFTRTGTTWRQEAYVKASNTEQGDEFGVSVALSADGSTLAVGAFEEAGAGTGIDGPEADNAAPAAGAVYVFTRSGAAWRQQAYVKASNTGSGDEFGATVALSGDGSTLAVGAFDEASAATGVNGSQADNAAPQSGAVYVYTRTGTAWRQQAYVKASNTAAGDQFGVSVALAADGSTLAAGARFEASAATGIDGDQTDSAAPSAGAAYVFARRGTTWSQEAYVKASNTGQADLFGWNVALSGDGASLAVSALLEASAATGIGGDQTDNAAPIAGAVYRFLRQGTTWRQAAYVKASHADPREFGWSIALSGDASTLAVGALLESSTCTGIDCDPVDDTAPVAGAVFVIR